MPSQAGLGADAATGSRRRSSRARICGCIFSNLSRVMAAEESILGPSASLRSFLFWHTINSLLQLALGRFASMSASARGCPPRRQINVPNSCKSQRFYSQMEALPSKAVIHSRTASRLAKFQSMLGHFVLRMRAAIATGSECALAIHASAKLADLDLPCTFSSTRTPVFVASSIKATAFSHAANSPSLRSSAPSSLTSSSSRPIPASALHTLMSPLATTT
jgi:hypothetical protein